MRQTTPSAFTWDHEPSEERPSEFMNSTSYSLLSGYHVLPDDERVKRRRQRRRARSIATWSWLSLILVVGAVIILSFARHVRG
ncbi:hypothetical protein [uncultured Methylibium sp.]|uniref:hypothetical protein n=1 Tax=uncultured Methylibium sp. TaxID=381093 RepID=UPI0025FE1156|nr:hypothetical protein [uncultured Methylibium sp.]